MTIAEIYESAKRRLDKNEITIGEFCNIVDIAVEQLKWIPVSERLPKDGELVLFSTKTDEVFEGRYCDDNTPLQWYSFCDDTFAWNNVVTAWMPLPQPYKAESEVANDSRKGD